MGYVLLRWLAEKTGEIGLNKEFIGKREDLHDRRYLNMLIS